MEAGGDWDLQAVVRGCRGGATASSSSSSSLPCSPLLLPAGDDGGGGGKGSVVDNDDGVLFCFPNLLRPDASLPELEQLYKPFFPPSTSPKQTATPAPSTSSSVVSLLAGKRKQLEPRPPPPQRSVSGPTGRSSKRRKSQQKRVICHVPADGLSADMWAWRKYGQKPIKGSPYPRGYYRCSSSKGCPARKQVERSRADPGVFVITYTAEHNHPVPTHRNSLAGSTRHKFPQPQQVDVSPSPTTPLSSDDAAKKESDEEEEEGMLLVSDMEILGEDDLLFLDLDDIAAGQFQAPLAASPAWMANGTAAAGGG